CRAGNGAVLDVKGTCGVRTLHNTFRHVRKSDHGAVASYWQKAEYGRIVSRMYIAWCLAATSLPVLAGRLYDLTGGYEIAVIVAGSGTLLAVLVALTLPRQKLAQ